jgi:hypothetical protein
MRYSFCFGLSHLCRFVIQALAAGKTARVAKLRYFAKLNVVDSLAVTADACMLHRTVYPTRKLPTCDAHAAISMKSFD